jgi:hypothetical protein
MRPGFESKLWKTWAQTYDDIPKLFVKGFISFLTRDDINIAILKQRFPSPQNMLKSIGSYDREQIIDLMSRLIIISTDELKENKDYIPWNWKLLSMNTSFTQEDFEATKHIFPWVDEAIELNPGIIGSRVVSVTHSNAQEYNTFYKDNSKLSFYLIASNAPSINIDIIKQCHPKLIPCFSGVSLSMNKSITFQDIQDTPQIKWHLPSFSRNPNATLEVVEANPDFPWNWDQLYKHIDIHLEELLEVASKYPAAKWESLAHNPNMFASAKAIMAKYRKYRSARLIQRAWRTCINNPEYAICRKRLLREFAAALCCED